MNLAVEGGANPPQHAVGNGPCQIGHSSCHHVGADDAEGRGGQESRKKGIAEKDHIGVGEGAKVGQHGSALVRNSSDHGGPSAHRRHTFRG